MNGEIRIMDMGNEVSVEVYRDGNVEIKIGNLPLVIMSGEQARNLNSALRSTFPVKVKVGRSGFPLVEG